MRDETVGLAKRAGCVGACVGVCTRGGFGAGVGLGELVYDGRGDVQRSLEGEVEREDGQTGGGSECAAGAGLDGCACDEDRKADEGSGGEWGVGVVVLHQRVQFGGVE